VLYSDAHVLRQLCRERAAELAAAAQRTRIPTGPRADRSGRATPPPAQVTWLLHELRGDEPGGEPAYRAP
jgi:hypothetical protein